jgi:mycofactocin biosynthesis protein MftB
LSVTEARPAGAAAAGASFAVEEAWQLNPQVALRDESFGALAYHYGNRRLVFLKSRLLVELVSSLDKYPSASEAIAAMVPAGQHDAYRRALGRLAASEVIDVR